MADMDQLIAELKEARRVFDAEDKEAAACRRSPLSLHSF